MPDYSKGNIYTIRCRTDETSSSNICWKHYTSIMRKRLAQHKRHSKRDGQINTKIYKEINNDWENWYIELYTLYPCSSKE